MLHFHTTPPFLHLPSAPSSLSRHRSISSGISKLLNKKAIKQVTPCINQFVSPIFIVPKKDSLEGRIIINLKLLNTYIFRTKFKIEGYEVIVNMISQYDFMCSIDLQDAFLAVSMHPNFFCYLCFEWEGVRYCFTSMPFGLTSAPRIFTKILKTVLVFFRGRGIKVTAFFDDLIIFAASSSKLLEHVYFIRLTLRSLGFIVNDSKSSLSPSQLMSHLGFLWNSSDLTLSVPSEKVDRLKLLCETALSRPTSLRFLQKILGTIESFRLAFPLAALHYRQLQQEVAQLISSGSGWDRLISPSPSSRLDLQWWVSCSSSLPPRSLAPFVPQIIVTTDSSGSGWGGFTSQDEEASGFWTDAESELHINVLETLAVIFCFQCFFRHVQDVSILVRSDNTTTVSYINHLGGVHAPEISDQIIKLYEFCLERNISIKATYLKGKKNTRADSLSRRVRDHCYSLPLHSFHQICSFFRIFPEVDLFASRLNAKVKMFFSYGPDPEASGFEAFSQVWPCKVYAFPPIMLIGKFLSRFIASTSSDGILILPFWPTQPYFPSLLEVLFQQPLFFPAALLEGTEWMPRHATIFLACPITTRPEALKVFRASLSQDSSAPLTQKLSAHTAGTGTILKIGWLGRKCVLARSLLMS